MRRKLVVVGLTCGLVLLLAACGSGEENASKGILTGTAQACAGLPGSTPSSAQVTVFMRGTSVAHRVIRNGGTYRIVLVPGVYDVTNEGTPGSGLGLGTTIIAGKTTHLDLPNSCS